MLLIVGLLIVAAWTDQRGRLFVLLLAGALGVLMLVPIWWVHYASLMAGPLALTVGTGISPARQWLAAGGKRQDHAVISLLAIFAVVVYGLPLLRTTTLDTPFPGNKLKASVAASTGCITSDHPIAL